VPSSAIDLNALPATAAGPVEASSFALTRLALESGGHRLFVYHGVPDMRLASDGSAALQIPTDAFAHTDPTAIVQLEARLASGAPLPAWLRFDGLRGVLTGIPPENTEEMLEIEVLARDTEGREARARFTLEVDALRTTAAAGVRLGLDVDKEEAEKARLKGKVATATAEARPAKPGAKSFSDQIGAAKTQRDPLLDRITSPDKTKTTPDRVKPGARR
jgi:hypothetical protein